MLSINGYSISKASLDAKQIEKIKKELKEIDSINISVDGWSDAIMRCFNGFIAQGKIY
jgi:uncharacterized membrane-anchored protein